MTSRGQCVDPLDVIERAYAVELPESEWLGDILEQAAPAVDAGCGVLAYLYDVTASPITIWNLLGNFKPSRKELVDVITAVDDEFVAQTYPVTPYGTASARPGFERHHTFGRLHQYGIRDVLGINAFDPSGLGVWIGGFLPEKRDVTADERERWAKVSMHITAAFRLRRRLGGHTKSRPLSPDAILSTSGKLEHAVDDVHTARAHLGEAVRRLDRARGGMRKADPDGAIDAWTVLVRARWSLVDQIDSDGRRYVLAYRNVSAPGAGPATFTEREREVVALTLLGRSPKLIAYELGLAHSTVRVHLTNASRKLNARTRGELIAKYREWLFQQQQP